MTIDRFALHPRVRPSRAAIALVLGASVAVGACSAAPEGDGGASTSQAAVGARSPAPKVTPDGIRSTCISPVNMKNQGGGSMSASSVSLVPVYWGSTVSAATTAIVPKLLQAFATDGTPYLDWLRTEYGAPYVTPGSGVTISPQGYDPSTPQTVTQDQIEKELGRQITSGALSGASDQLYLVHLPANVTAYFLGDAQCTTWCGYHYFFAGPHGTTYYTVIPDTSVSLNCQVACYGPGVTERDSHEIAEALTDPDGISGWRDPAQPAKCGPEIGDLCANQSTTIPVGDGTTVTVQKLWSNLANDCVTGDETPTIAKISPSYGPNAGGTQVTITGARFALGSATTFTFGGVPATNVSCTDTSTCTATTPADVATGAKLVQVAASVTVSTPLAGGGNRVTSSWDGPQDNFQYAAGPKCTASLSCAGVPYGYPNLVVSCPPELLPPWGIPVENTLFFFEPGNSFLGVGGTITQPTDGVGGTVWACQNGSCSPFSILEENADYCGAPPPPKPTWCQTCEAEGGVCRIEGGHVVCVAK